jgi:hypothetical protein
VWLGSIALIACGAHPERWLAALVVSRVSSTRDGSPMASVVAAARDGWEHSQPDVGEDESWAGFDARWGRVTLPGGRWECRREP